MRPLHVSSLYLKLVVPIVGLVLATVALESFFGMRAMSEGVRLVAGQRAQFGLAYTRNSIEDIEHVMLVDHGLKLQSALERLAGSPDLEAVRILASDGRVLHSSKKSEVGTMLKDHVPPLPKSGQWERDQVVLMESPGVMHAAGPVFNRRRCNSCHGNDRRILAFVDAEINLSKQTAGMRSWGRLAAVSGVLQFGAIALAVASFLTVVVVRPIRRLVDQMSRVQHGDFAVRADPTGTAELDILTTGFNDMVARLHHASLIEQEAQRTKMVRVEQLATIGEMAASLAHELRNPLAGVKAAIDVLAKEEPLEEPRMVLEHASEELGRVDGVVRQLLNFAKPKAPVVGPVTIAKAIDDALMLLHPRATAQHARLEREAGADEVVVLADPEMAHQIAVNLLINALHAVEKKPDGAVTVSIGTREGEGLCRVSDNGPGVPEDRAEAIFRPFMTTKIRGTGLGLATSRRLVELQGGRLWLDNPGQPGACFVFSLPLVSTAGRADT